MKQLLLFLFSLCIISIPSQAQFNLGKLKKRIGNVKESIENTKINIPSTNNDSKKESPTKQSTAQNTNTYQKDVNNSAIEASFKVHNYTVYNINQLVDNSYFDIDRLGTFMIKYNESPVRKRMYTQKDFENFQSGKFETFRPLVKYEDMIEKLNEFFKHSHSVLMTCIDEQFKVISNPNSWEDDVKYAKIHLGQIDTLLTLTNSYFSPQLPNAKKVAKYCTKIRSMVNEEQSSLINEIAVSDLHKKNINKLLFTSNANLNMANATESDFKSSFNCKDDIYAVAFLNKKYKDKYRDGASMFKVYDEDRGHTDASTIICNVDVVRKPFNPNLSYVYFKVYTSPKNYLYKDGMHNSHPTNIFRFLKDLGPRPYSIKVCLSSTGRTSDGNAIIGGFSFDGDGARQEMAKRTQEANNMALASKEVPQAKMRNTKIEKELIQLFNQMGWKEHFFKCIIVSPTYTMVREYGRIVGRTLSVEMISKIDGNCMAQTFTVLQPKTGSNTYGKWQRLSTGNQKKLPCHKVTGQQKGR